MSGQRLLCPIGPAVDLDRDVLHDAAGPEA